MTTWPGVTGVPGGGGLMTGAAGVCFSSTALTCCACLAIGILRGHLRRLGRTTHRRDRARELCLGDEPRHEALIFGDTLHLHGDRVDGQFHSLDALIADGC